jgi:4,5-dihydroxyphthalate decarboxylase
VVVDEEHVQEYRKPPNVLERPGARLAEMVASGELAAAIGAGKVEAPDVRPLIPDAAEAEAAWYRKTGIYPINHTVVVKDALLQADATLAPRLFGAFKAAKAGFLGRLAAGAEPSPEAQALARRRAVVGDDPLPYGLARNRPAIEAVIRFAVDQRILPGRVDPEAMFAGNTLDLD